ncbi:hypothetical protein ACFVZT_29300 [Streptomyces sp. NPDC058321]|uniref:hypothetical protein n=1 Tax=unclassified Streptomyces TaxID=2593676 RepID=UPI002E8100BB|nr:hypothetical protein [Streptomyces sp. NBC_00569]WUB96563.1 hypothetical protein OHO83_32030 [Streptomyces sp. NBC_00569]
MNVSAPRPRQHPRLTYGSVLTRPTAVSAPGAQRYPHQTHSGVPTTVSAPGAQPYPHQDPQRCPHLADDRIRT